MGYSEDRHLQKELRARLRRIKVLCLSFCVRERGRLSEGDEEGNCEWVVLCASAQCEVVLCQTCRLISWLSLPEIRLFCFCCSPSSLSPGPAIPPPATIVYIVTYHQVAREAAATQGTQRRTYTPGHRSMFHVPDGFDPFCPTRVCVPVDESAPLFFFLFLSTCVL